MLHMYVHTVCCEAVYFLRRSTFCSHVSLRINDVYFSSSLCHNNAVKRFVCITWKVAELLSGIFLKAKITQGLQNTKFTKTTFT